MEAPKRKPGRPPKRAPDFQGMIKNGITNTPLDADALVEFYTYLPIEFKHMFAMDRSLGSRDLYIFFNADNITIASTDFATNDNKGRSPYVNIKIIDCKDCNHYYCAAPVMIVISRDGVGKFFDKYDKSQVEMKLVLLRSESQRFMRFIMKPDSSERTHTVHLVKIISAYAEVETKLREHISQLTRDLSSADLVFSLNTKTLKSDMSDAQPMFSIEKVPGSMLQFKWSEQGTVVETFTNYDDVHIIEDKNVDNPAHILSLGVPTCNISSFISSTAEKVLLYATSVQLVVSLQISANITTYLIQ